VLRKGRMRVAGVVLAAGSATRMGQNKLLLPVGEEPLVRRAVRTACAAGLAPVLVVVGPDEERVRGALAGLAFEPVPNPRHALGMSTSLDAGISAVPADSAAAVVLLADMPFVDAGTIRAVVALHEKGARLVTARYGGVPAPPTLYDRSFFPELRGGAGEGRGREVVRRHAGEVAFVDLPASALADVDEAKDLERARARLDQEAS